MKTNRILSFSLLTLLLIALPILFFWRHLTTPFDGGRLMPDTDNITPYGVVVMPPAGAMSGLQAGDIVTAVEGRSVEQYARMPLVASSAASPLPHLVELELGDTLRYTVVRDGREQEIDVTLTTYPLGAVLRGNWSLIAFGLAYFLVGTFVLTQRPQLLSARLLFLASLAIFSASITWSSSLTVGDFLNSRVLWLYYVLSYGVYLSYYILNLHFTSSFPRPLPVVATRRRTYLLYGLTYACWVVTLLVSFVRSPTLLSWLASWEPLMGIFAFVLLALTLLAGAWQYRTNREGATRQQIRWVIFALLFCGGMLLALYLFPPLLGLPPLSINLLAFVLLGYPLAVAAAVLRYRLFEIDVLIRRTLVYTILTTLLALVYFASVILLQHAFSLFTIGQSTLAVVVSTLLIAALFNPLRRRLQTVIDRRFYRQRYDAHQVLATFAGAVRMETDPDRLASALLQVVQETMHPAYMSLCVVRRIAKTTVQ